MRNALIRLHIHAKGLLLLLRPHAWLGWSVHPFRFAANTLALSAWIARQRKGPEVMNDFHTFSRVHAKREQLHAHVIRRSGLHEAPIDYLEFGVFDGRSFRWWLAHATHADSRFHGFDTFEGLPEQWGAFAKGDMAATVPVLEDPRGRFHKGLFQDTLLPFLRSAPFADGRRKVIHLDADLYSSTLFVLTALGPHLRAGDVLLFDEFNVPNHEFAALQAFQASWYVRTELLGAVNNYYQVALLVV
ncbi:MAG TPA: class I SAM-dependent methyltransferase [Flavobacteriales bacterium]|nr:class I SAM-dependent methyltransferase [Flavobacteriales bacterium]HMR28302.1 class I SAM-dependent methyltransferase [Flavobacteriales bacterium]